MLELTADTIAKASERTRKQRPFVARVTDAEIAVSCRNEDHPRGHVARFERRGDGSLWGECVLRHTGELCPAMLGKHVCYHLSAGVVLYLALEEMRAAEDRDGQTEHAVMYGGALPQPARSTARPRETVREIRAP